MNDKISYLCASFPKPSVHADVTSTYKDIFCRLIDFSLDEDQILGFRVRCNLEGVHDIAVGEYPRGSIKCCCAEL